MILTENEGESNTYVFGDIFKSIPTLFEFLLQMVEERPEVLETNDIKLMKREIEINNCDQAKYDGAKREVKRTIKYSNIPTSNENDNKVGGDSLQVIARASGNVEVNREMSSRHEIKCSNDQSHPKINYVSSYSKNEESKIFLNDMSKRNDYYGSCPKSLRNVENKRKVEDFSDNTIDVKITDKYGQNNNAVRSIHNIESNAFRMMVPHIDESFENIITPENDNKKISLNKKEGREKNQARYKKLASDMNTFNTVFLTPEDVEEHIFKVDQMLEEHKRNKKQ